MAPGHAGARTADEFSCTAVRLRDAQAVWYDLRASQQPLRCRCTSRRPSGKPNVLTLRIPSSSRYAFATRASYARYNLATGSSFNRYTAQVDTRTLADQIATPSCPTGPSWQRSKREATVFGHFNRVHSP